MGGVGAYLEVNDNSGIRFVKCIKIPKVTRKNVFKGGDYIIVAVNKGHLKKKFSNKKIALGLVTTVKKKIRRSRGYFVKFDNSRVVLFSNKEKTIGTRLYGPITFEAKAANQTKIIKFARRVI